jgi:exosortase A-associated hydrolase 2
LLEAEFIQGEAGRLFCTFHDPAPSERRAPVQPAVIVVPAFGDEMNKTRQTLAGIGKLLNQAGIALIIPDLFGTGDSEGEFREATWEGWRSDVLTVARHAGQRGTPVSGAIAIRTGALLLADALTDADFPELTASVWLQPTWHGEQYLTQLLRLRALSTAVAEGKSETVADLRGALAQGQLVNVGGYELSPSIATALASRRLEDRLSPRLGELCSIEVTRQESKVGEVHRDVGGVSATISTVLGEPYWSATEIVVNHDVVGRCVGHFTQHLGP